MTRLLPLVILSAGCALDRSIPDADGDGVPWPRDCDDADPGVHPGATETCDGRDEDCDGFVDEEVSVSAWYRDGDGDGWGDGDTRTYACAAPEGFVAEAGDCDDGDAAIAPDAEDGECDGIDQDCDGRDGPCLDLATTIVLQGSTPGEWAGCSVAGVGDLDGDGYDDVLIGAVNWGDGGTHRGAAWLVRGGRSLAGGDLGSVGLLFKGDAWRDFAGWAVAGAGDVNGDGFHDLVVGAPSSDAGTNSGGVAYLVLGGPEPTGRPLAEADAVYTGSVHYESAGEVLAGGGDVDGDGLDDLLVGAPYGGGRVYLVLGSASPMDRSLGEADASFFGVQGLDHVGSALALAGDTDGDGLCDLLLGAPYAYGDGGNCGQVYLVRGRPSPSDLDLADADACFTGIEDSEAGVSVAGAGDVDGDGLDDLLIGARDCGYPAWRTLGAAHLILGSAALQDRDLAEADATFTSPFEDDRAGTSVSGAGDVDDDGFADLLVGAYRGKGGENQAGAAYLIRGAASLAGGRLDLAERHLLGVHEGDEAGYCVSAAGDVDGDGFPDLLVGAPRADLGGLDSGAAYLVLGSTLGW